MSFLKGNAVSDALIRLEHVSWAYSRAHEWALKNISLTVGEGEFIAVMGENGAGKTTLCRLLNGLIPHSLSGTLTGSVTIDGTLTADSPVAQLAKKAGMVFEDPQAQLFTARVDDEVAFALENLLMPAGEIRERVGWALEVTGLSAYASRVPATLSGGQKQRLAIAAALAMARKILVLDEPVSQLDPEGAQEILALIRDLRTRNGLTVVMATHCATEAAECADRICVLKNGCLAADSGIANRVVQKLQFLNNFHNEKASFQSFSPKNAGLVREPTGFLNKSNVIAVSHLYAEYTAGNPVLTDINLVIKENEFTAICGQNGSGKTTLLKNISGLLRPVRGTILLRGKDTASMSIAEIAGEIGFVMQDPDRQLFESTVYDEVAFTLKRAARGRTLKKNALREEVEEALSLTGLLDRRDAFPLALNRADRMKTVFAAILATGPKIIMLDEPVAGQDTRGSHLIMELLANLHQQSYTILMITHNMSVITEYARRIIKLKDGNIVMDGKPS
jgi:energy-coupling factor transport system ATP-binding protein